ncbi:serine hydrolase domain-containing protein [Polymorphospora sp. NPDC050346]|uniref:serine hydrolase domain-containing protein n=1 Tax=Polymorphospora sp. NPDC050346 TaxID=3155780 RepID=UPI0034072E54
MKITRPLVAAALAGLVAAGLATFAAPSPAGLTGDRTGDTGPATRVRDAVDDPAGYRGLAVATVDGGQVRVAGIGERGTAGGDVDAGTPFESGSLTKVMTGMLLADLVADGVVTPDDTLRQLFPGRAFEDPAVGDVTLAELAGHTSGLPRLAPAPGGPLSTVVAAVRGTDPYAGQDAAHVLGALTGTRVRDHRGEVTYSNFGMAVLGLALAERAGTAYPELLRQRLLDPLGMTATGFVGEGDPLPAGAATGGTGAGRPMRPWRAGGLAAAGIGMWTTADDLARLLAATMAGTAPGADATTPRYGPDDERIGFGWFTTRYDDREIVWHNGATGGFSAYVGFERATGRGVVLLGNTDRGVEAVGLRLLGVDRPTDGPDANWLLIAVTVVLLAGGGLGLAATATGTGSTWRPAPDRLGLAGGVLSAAASLVLAHRAGAWLDVPAVLWPVAVGFAVAGVVLAVFRWPGLPLIGRGTPWVRWTGAAIGAVVSGGLILAVAVLT